MPSPMEYDVRVRRLSSVSVALFSAALIFASSTLAQNNGASSPGTAGSMHSATGSVAPPTGAVIPFTGAVHPPTGNMPGTNFHGSTAGSRVTFSGSGGGNRSHDGDDRHRHHSRNAYAVPFLYPYPVPYAGDDAEADNSADANVDDDDADYQGGPTVFDRRGSGADSYVPPVADASTGAPRRDKTSVVPERPQPATLLVFKDGHTVELGNYAIVGATLFDLTPGHTRKIAVADIDLAATQRQNDDRGVSFALPAPSQAN